MLHSFFMAGGQLPPSFPKGVYRGLNERRETNDTNIDAITYPNCMDNLAKRRANTKRNRNRIGKDRGYNLRSCSLNIYRTLRLLQVTTKPRISRNREKGMEFMVKYGVHKMFCPVENIYKDTVGVYCTCNTYSLEAFPLGRTHEWATIK